MRYLVVPHDAMSDAATLWVAAIAEPTDGLELEVGAGRVQPLSGNWNAFEVHGQPMVRAQRVRVAGLGANRRYPVRLLQNGVERARATAVTLPERLPALDEPPFICLLGSCFAQLSDEGGSAGAAYVGVASASRPHVKFLCGDQVYLDTPPGRFLWTVHAEQDLRAELLARYVAAWTQDLTAGGFNRILRDGATFFTSDDHELWNNAPNRTPLVRATWWPGGDRGAAWQRIATELFDMFQT
ncbi:MAG: hypothetical protein M3253_01560, partial [Chloroflexota bacterium]|nr:hypothetical protein [Chloroflexota bacterium]